MILHAWDLNVKRTTKAFNGFSDEELFTEVAPGKNRVIYLLGHLVAVHDMMLPLLGLGERNYPQLDEAFINSPDREVADLPTVQELRIYWNDINMILEGYFKNLTPDEWLARHTAVSEEDFAKEPHRNRLSIVINRTNHLSYHLGQIILAKK
jgi:hypothetical protein